MVGKSISYTKLKASMIFTDTLELNIEIAQSRCK